MAGPAIFRNQVVKFLVKAGILVPARGTVDRSNVPVAGELGFNTNSKSLEVYDGNLWTNVGLQGVQIEDVTKVPATLDIDFTNPSGVPAGLTFTRNSIGTYFGYDGYLKTASTNQMRHDFEPITGEPKGLLIEESRVNLLTNTEHFDANWTNSRSNSAKNAEIAPDGSLTMTKLVETTDTGAHYTRSNGITITANTTYNISIFAKAGERTKIRITLFDTVTATNGINLDADLSNGTIIGTSVDGLGSLTPNSAKIENVGNSIYRISVSGIIDSSSTSARMWISTLDATGTWSYTGDGKSGLYIWGAQLEAGAFLTSYVPSAQTFTSRASSATYYDASGIIQSASTNVARNTYNPSPDKLYLSPKLLLETQATNNFLQSENFSTTWTTESSTVGSASIVKPDGTSTSSNILITSTATGSAGIIQNYSATVNVAFTVSFFVKRGTATDFFSIRNLTQSGTVYFTPETKTITRDGGTDVSGSIEVLPNGWYRLSATFLPTSTQSLSIRLRFNSTAIGQTAYFWGAQLETGYCSTSYIPTTTASVTRSADVYTSASVTRQADNASMTGTNFTDWYRFDEGTMYVSGDRRALIGTRFFSIHDGTSQNQIRFTSTISGTQLRADWQILSAGITQANILSQTLIDIGQPFSIAGTYKLNDFQQATNGVLGVADASGIVPLPNQITIGANEAGTSNINGHIRRIIFWPKRLDNNTIQTITALP